MKGMKCSKGKRRGEVNAHWGKGGQVIRLDGLLKSELWGKLVYSSNGKYGKVKCE